MENNRKVIGLIVEDVFLDFAKEIVSSVANVLAGYRDVTLVVISGEHVEEQTPSSQENCYKLVFNSIYRLEELCEFDGLIIATRSMEELKNRLKEPGVLRQYNTLPKVFLTLDVPGEICVNYDNETGIREAVDCLINAYGLTKICMLGGRDDNADAVDRKLLFEKCLREWGMEFPESAYEKTDMSSNCEEAVVRLLDRNPGVQAIFCVNDVVARTLYAIMQKRHLRPGRDIYVFGFDNTRMGSEMDPALSSIGTQMSAMGHKALDLLFDQWNGKEVSSVRIPTRLFGRESMPYDKYDYTMQELLEVNADFINRMFDDCFYRYEGKKRNRTDINLRRLYFEFIHRMLTAVKNRYMSEEEFGEICRLIDIFFANGAMEYTDSAKLISCVEKLQGAMNMVRRTVAVNTLNNRLFLRMKDRAIEALARSQSESNRKNALEREGLTDFLVRNMRFRESRLSALEMLTHNFHKLGFRNAALYLYETPIRHSFYDFYPFSEAIYLKAVVRNGELYLPQAERQKREISKLFDKMELSSKCREFMALPVFHGQLIYGILLCELTQEVFDRGEMILGLMNRVIDGALSHMEDL